MTRNEDRQRSDRVLRRECVWVTALALALMCALASGTGVAQSKSKSGPVMEIEPEEFDFGGVEQDQKLVHEFTIHNVGTEDLEIRRISTSCGCTAAIPAERVVKPGGSTTLEVVLETRKYKGVIDKSVSVASNDRAVVRTVRVRAFVEVREE